MLLAFLSGLGAWNWIFLGLALLVLEILLPGVFLLWIGIAALAVGALSLAVWDSAWWIWQVQVVAFLVLSLACALLGRRLMGGGRVKSDQPLLNRRGEQLVGRVATLGEPITDGRGRLRLDDTMWRVSGPDLPAGTRVRVASLSSSELELVVEPA
jgi:membrane protein implicated in regulation of membrane protease activity